MNPRFAQNQLISLLDQFPAVVLLGPRQTGKTTLAQAEMARRRNAIYLDLELPSALRQLDPDGHQNSPTCGHLKFPHPPCGVMTG